MIIKNHCAFDNVGIKHRLNCSHPLRRIQNRISVSNLFKNCRLCLSELHLFSFDYSVIIARMRVVWRLDVPEELLAHGIVSLVWDRLHFRIECQTHNHCNIHNQDYQMMLPNQLQQNQANLQNNNQLQIALHNLLWNHTNPDKNLQSWK